MSEETQNEHYRAVEQIRQHQFTAFLVVVIAISMFLVYISLSLYHSSGAYPLDLSRPGLDEARKEASKENQVFEGFSADGPIDAKSLREFDTLYTKEMDDATAINAFGGDPLSDKSLHITNK